MINPPAAALIIIDMQLGFIDPVSALCVPGAAQTVPACARALEHARTVGMPVFHLIRDYAVDGSDVEVTRHALWEQGDKPLSAVCSPAAAAQEPEPLTPQKGDRIITKPRFSAFFQTKLDLVLRRLGVQTVVLIGTTTPNCIRTSCYDALSLDYNVVILEDCTSSRTPAVQAANIEDMRHIGAHIMTCDEFCVNSLDAVTDWVEETKQAVQLSNAKDAQ